MAVRKKFIRAFHGLIRVLTAESSIRFDLLAALAVFMLAWWLHVSRVELILLVLVVVGMVVLEGFNTVLEHVIDLVEPRYRDLVRDIKDALAGLVLLASMGAALIGVLIFSRYIV